jgi:double-strand break repair protein MRE11
VEPTRASSELPTFVLQPGSTVATSLSEGEARQKHAFLLEIRGSNFRTTPIPLRCVRPFFLRTVCLATESRIDPSAPDAAIKVQKFLQQQVCRVETLNNWCYLCLLGHTLFLQVANIVEDAKKSLASMPEDTRPPPSMQMPLVRLKVDHTGFGVLANQRFGSA